MAAIDRINKIIDITGIILHIKNSVETKYCDNISIAKIVNWVIDSKIHTHESSICTLSCLNLKIVIQDNTATNKLKIKDTALASNNDSFCITSALV